MIRKSSNRHPTCQDTELYAVRWLHLRIDVPMGRLQLQVDVLVGRLQLQVDDVLLGRSNPSENIKLGAKYPALPPKTTYFRNAAFLYFSVRL